MQFFRAAFCLCVCVWFLFSSELWIGNCCVIKLVCEMLRFIWFHGLVLIGNSISMIMSSLSFDFFRSMISFDVIFATYLLIKGNYNKITDI